MKLFGKITICITIAIFILITFFMCLFIFDDDSIFKIALFSLLGCCVICLTIMECFSSNSIKKKKLEILNEITKTLKNKPTDKNINKQLEEIHNELKRINSNIEEIKNDTSRNNIDTEKISKKMKELENILTPLDFNSDMFKAYANAIVEI